MFFSLEFFALLDWTSTGTVQLVDFVLRVFYLKAISREYFSYVLISVRSTISNACVICFGLGVRIWRSPSTSNATKGCRKWCETAVFPAFHKFQHSLWTMNATMKVNGKLWTLALGFKEGLFLGDRTSAQSTLLTWGVNSVWSNLNSWREEWRQHQTLYKSLQVNSSIYGFWNDIKTHKCGAININCSAQAGLHWTMHEHRARMKLWRFWRMQNLGRTNVSTRAGRSFRSPKLPARRSYSHRFWLRLCFTWGMKPEHLRVEQLSCWCDLWIDGAALMFHAPLVISVRKCKHLCAHKQITVFREVQNWRNMFLIWVFFLLRYVSTTETTLYQRAFWSFLPTILFAWSVWSHHAASWHILPSLWSPCAGDKLASLLAHLPGTNSQGCQFPCWNCSGPLSFGLVHWFCPSNTNLPLLHGCASGSNSSGWKRACLGLHMLKVWQ